jgi:lipoprotein Spr
MSPASRALARARAVIDAPFRLHGRDLLRGFDCVGLVALAWDVEVPTGYAMRGTPRALIERTLATLGFVQCGEKAGAIVLAATGPGQLHLAISTGKGVIHADAVARRVIERPAPLPWPILAAWIREE